LCCMVFFLFCPFSVVLFAMTVPLIVFAVRVWLVLYFGLYFVGVARYHGKYFECLSRR
jgi:hypothetical protein